MTGRRRLVALVSALVTALAGTALAAVVVPGAASAETNFGSPLDSNIRYVGRWDLSNPSAAVPGWAGAYVSVGFTGTTVKLRQRNTVDLWASIDGGAFTLYKNVSGTVNLTPTALNWGTHRLQVTYRTVAGSYKGDAVFQGITLDSGARTVAPTMRSKLVEFIGDSITVGYLTTNMSVSAYPWLVGDALGAEHTQVAEGGACLAAPSSGCTSMAAGFLRTSSAGGSWDFSKYSADAVVINLGTNDVGSNRVSTEEFISTYVGLLRNARARYPNAAIIALEPFRQRFGDEEKSAVDQVRAAGDNRVQYVDTEGWIDSSTDTSDGVHPNDSGHQKVASRLAPIVSAAMAATSSSSSSSTSTSTTSPTPTTSTPSPTSTSTPLFSDSFESGTPGAWTVKSSQNLTLDVVSGGVSGSALAITAPKRIKAGPKRIVDTKSLVAGRWYQVTASVRVGDGLKPAVFTLAPTQKISGLVVQPARSSGSWANPTAAFPWSGKGKVILALTASMSCDGDALPAKVLLDDVTLTEVDPSSVAEPQPVSCSTPSGPLGSNVQVVGAASGRCMWASGTSAGSAVVLADCDSSSARQRWTWYPGSGEIRPGTSSQVCLQASSSPASKGSKVVVGACGSGETLWGGTDSTLVHGSSGLCLDAYGKGTAAGTELVLWTCNGGANQQWSGR